MFKNRYLYYFTLLIVFYCVVIAFPLAKIEAHNIPTVSHRLRLEYTDRKVLYLIAYTYDPIIVHRYLNTFDTNNDRMISDEEERAWIQKYISNVSVRFDGEVQTMRETKYDFPSYADFVSGKGTITVEGEIDKEVLCRDRIVVEMEDKNVFLSPQDDIYNFGNVVQGCLRAKEESVKGGIGKAIVGDVDVDSLSDGQVLGSTSNKVESLKDILSNPSEDKMVYFVALAIAVFVGALHALTPGHGKTLVAAYLVGQRGTVRDALLLAGVTTLTHTFSIYLLGFTALFATQYFYPEKIIPVLEAISALSIFGIGIWLLVRRWDEYRKSKKSEASISGGTVFHSHGGSEHSHDLSDLKGKRLSIMSLVSLGFSGGIVPCVDALAIMILSISLNQITFGMILILFFSLGLAGVLVILGILLVTSKKLLEKRLPLDKFSRVAPLVSAVIIVILGIYLTLRLIKI